MSTSIPPKEIYAGKKKVYYASSIDDASIVGFEDSINVYLKNGKKSSIKEVGNYSILASRKNQAILYDADNQNTLAVIGTKIYSNDYALTGAEITNKNNIVLTADDTVSLYRKGEIVPTNSNFKDNTYFISRNNKHSLCPLQNLDNETPLIHVHMDKLLHSLIHLSSYRYKL